MSKKTHKSILFFHGVGAARRGASMASFLDFFDLFSRKLSKDEKDRVGVPRRFKSVPKELNGDKLNYIEFERYSYRDLASGNKKSEYKGTVKAYEAYWSPRSNQEFSTWYAIIWAFRRFIMPFLVIFSDWRAYSSLKIMILHRMVGDLISEPNAQILEKKYREFEGWDSREKYKNGKFKEYLISVDTDIGGERSKILNNAAKKWKKGIRNYCIRILFIILCLIFCLFAILSLAASVFLLVWQSGSNFKDLTIVGSDFEGLVVFLFAFCVLLYWGVSILSKASLIRDVFLWTIDTEKDQRFSARKDVQSYARNLLRSILKDELCEECIIVSHSLGTCIAIDAVFEEGALILSNESEGGLTLEEMNKISTIYTVGSPVDLIFFMFFYDKYLSHRYSRFNESARGSVGLPPFWNREVSGDTRIVNFHSRFDLINTKLYSLRKSLGERKDAIKNIEVLPDGAPDPLGVHKGFFSNQDLISMIYYKIMSGEDVDINDVDFKGFRYTVWYLWVVPIFIYSLAAVLFSLHTFDVVPISAPSFFMWVFVGLYLHGKYIKKTMHSTVNGHLTLK